MDILWKTYAFGGQYNMNYTIREEFLSYFFEGGRYMLILIIGVLILSYGTYNILCYLFMLPTAAAGNVVSAVGRGKKQSFLDQALILIAENVVNRWELHWNGEERLEKYLRKKDIYISGTIYFVSKCIKLIGGVLIIFPVAFMYRNLFLFLILFWIFCCGWDIRESFFIVKKVNLLKILKIEKFFVSIFPWIYGIFNILILVKMFT